MPNRKRIELLAQADRMKTALCRRLLAWFRGSARDLPWRRSRDPYRIWVSEIILQQTRIEIGLEYYERIVQAFPDVFSLAAATEDRVLKLWEGLGYYGRARNLQKAARVLVRRRKGAFPQCAAEWRLLPGVGRSTAGAIASIAFGEPVAVLDGNVKRVLARVFRVERSIDESAALRDLWDLAEALVPGRSPGDFNQALMELGALVCLPKRPRCERCPLRKRCAAYRHGEQESLPRRKAKKAIPHKEIVAAAIRKDGRFLLARRPSRGLLGGLWEFPGGEAGKGETLTQALGRILKSELGIDLRVGRKLGSVGHAYSHFRITLNLYACELAAGMPRAATYSDVKWIPRGRFDRYAFHAACRKAASLLPDSGP
jgi:A/G-specific adenine glycosylase